MSEPLHVLERSLKRTQANTLMRLTQTNFIVWWEDLQNKLGCFADAGQEVLNKKHIDYSPDFPSRIYHYTFRNDAGELEEAEEEWSDYASRMLERANDAIEKKNVALKASRGQLWAQVVGCLQTEVVDRLKSTDKQAFDTARLTFDNVKLFDLLRSSCDALAQDQVFTLRTQLRELRHVLKDQFDSFCLKIESLFDQLAAAGDVMTEKHTTGHLMLCIDKNFFKSVITACLIYQIYDPEYPDYTPLKKQMAAYYRSMGPTSGNKRKQETETEVYDQDAEGKAYKKHHRKVVKVNALIQENRQLKAKLKLQDDAAPHHGSRDLSDVVCYRCGLKGHFSNDKTVCKAVDVKCANCKSDRHRTEFCKVIADQKAKKDGSNGKKPRKANVRTITVNLGTLSVQTAVRTGNATNSSESADSITATNDVTPGPIVGDHLPAVPRLGALSYARAVAPARVVNLKMITTAKKDSAQSEEKESSEKPAPAAVTPAKTDLGLGDYGTPTSQEGTHTAGNSPLSTESQEATPEKAVPETSAKEAPVEDGPQSAAAKETANDADGPQSADAKESDNHSEASNERFACQMDDEHSPPAYNLSSESEFTVQFVDYGFVGLEHESMALNNVYTEREKLIVLLHKALDRKIHTKGCRDDRRKQCMRTASGFGAQLRLYNRDDMLDLLGEQVEQLSDQAGRLNDVCELLNIEDDDDPILASIKESYLHVPHIPMSLRGDPIRDIEEAKKREKEAAIKEAATAKKKAETAANKNKGKKAVSAEMVTKRSGDSDEESEEEVTVAATRSSKKRAKTPSPPVAIHFRDGSTPEDSDDAADDTEDDDLERITHQSRLSASAAQEEQALAQPTDQCRRQQCSEETAGAIDE